STLTGNAKESVRRQTDTLNIYVATKRRHFDGQQLLHAISDESLNATVPIAVADQAKVGEYTIALSEWFARQYSLPAGVETAWDPRRLTYRMQAAAPRSDGTQLILDATLYNEGRLDWYSFEVDPNAGALVTDAVAPAVPSPIEPAISFLPVAASFKGMPNPRFWEMENRQINFGQLDAKTTDSLMLVFAELGLIYGNDGFVIPYAMTDHKLWRINGYDAADRFGIEPPPIAASTASIRYVLGTTVPENWIPFLPVHQAGSNQSIEFRRAAMPKLGVPPTDVVRPKGLLLTEISAR